MSTITVNPKIRSLLSDFGYNLDNQGLLNLFRVQTREDQRIRSEVHKSPHWWENTGRIAGDETPNKQRAGIRSQILRDLINGNIDKDVIEVLSSALSDDNNLTVRLEAVNLIKEKRLSSNKIIDTLARCLDEWPLRGKVRGSDDIELFRLSVVETLEKIGAKAVRVVPVLANELGVTLRANEGSSHPNDYYVSALKSAIKEICDSAAALV